MNREAYLDRIGLEGVDLSNDVPALWRLQRAHLLAIPFENLDIHWKRPIILDLDRFYDKIVAERRGGFCYELNGLFNELLKAVGFQTRLISARVFNGTDHGPEFDHAAIIVTIGEDEFLADVGFGDFATEPLRFVADEEQEDPSGVFVIRKFYDEYFEVAKRAGDEWKSEYIFKDVPRELSEFTEMCDFQQYSPESHFTKGKLCSMLTLLGRKTISDTGFIVTTKGIRHETPITTEVEFLTVLKREFGITKEIDKT